MLDQSKPKLQIVNQTFSISFRVTITSLLGSWTAIRVREMIVKPLLLNIPGILGPKGVTIRLVKTTARFVETTEKA